jgi:plastocyanin
VLDTDEKFSYTFTKAGTYSYYCTIHPKMTGKVVVQ